MRRFSITIKTLICQLGPFIIPDWELRLRLCLRLGTDSSRRGRGVDSVARHLSRRDNARNADELKSHQEVSGHKTYIYIYIHM